jgi:N utilization substance protein B
MSHRKPESRRAARERALQALFQLDLNHADDDAQASMYETLAIDTALGEAEQPLGDKSRAYMTAIVTGTRQHLAEIDALIQKSSKDWKVERMAGVDRNLCRMAAWEMYFSEDKLDPGIAINEAVELAKKYGTDDASRYVNGILGAMTKLA